MKTGRGVAGLTSGMKGAIAIAVLLSLSTVMPSTANTGMVDQRADLMENMDLMAEDVPLEGLVIESENMPTINLQPAKAQDAGGTPEPLVWVEGDFVVSYDDDVNALHPAVATTPSNTITEELQWAAGIHVVWDEIDETTGDREIHYSMTYPEMEGYPREWTNDEESEGDHIISEERKGKVPNMGDAVDPSIAVDSQGIIHVVWAQEYIENGAYWEIHYARSVDNGKHWSSEVGQVPGHDIHVSRYYGERNDAEAIPGGPKITISYNTSIKSQEVLHTAWPEYTVKNGQEILYSRSTDGGAFWNGVEVNQVISNSGGNYAFNPCIGATGELGEFIHVAWSQMMSGKASSEEIYYTMSNDMGGTWQGEETIISNSSIPGIIDSVGMATGKRDIHIAWAQRDPSGKASTTGVFYNGDFGGGWEVIEAPIDNFDNNIPQDISVAVSKASMEVHVVWNEIDEKSPEGTLEVHTSYSPAPQEQGSWSGLERDIVVSWPDKEPGMNAQNASVALTYFGGKWEPRIVWDEVNNPGGKGYNRAQQNNEIHFLPPLIITASSGSHGSISPSGAVSVPAGDDQTFDFNPDSHYHVSDVVVDGGSVGTPSSYTFNNVNSDHTIYVSFSIDRFSLSTAVSPGGSGSVTKNPNWSTYPYGYVVELTANDNTGWDFSSWSGHASGTSNPYYITMYGYRSVTANFVVETNIITASAGTGGTITPSGSVVVNYGDDKTFIIAASAGYAIKDVLVDSASQGALTTYTFLSVTSAHTIVAQFIPEYTQSLSTGWNRVSFPLIQSDTSIEAVLDSIDSYWDEARYFDALGEDWDTYENGVGGDLTDVNHKMGFWVHVTGPCTLTVTGNRPSSTVINLYTGWNMIGYPAENDGSYDIADLKSDVTAVQLVYKEDWRYLMTELGNSYILQNGEMYWVFVNSDTTWTVNW